MDQLVMIGGIKCCIKCCLPCQSNGGQTYIGVGKLNERLAKVPRDTGCTRMIVDRASVAKVLVILGSLG